MQIDGEGTNAVVKANADTKANDITYNVAVDNETTKLVGSIGDKKYVKVEVENPVEGQPKFVWKEYDPTTGLDKDDAVALTAEQIKQLENIEVVAAKSAKSTVVTAGEGVTVKETPSTKRKPAYYEVAVAIDTDTMEMKEVPVTKDGKPVVEVDGAKYTPDQIGEE